MLVAFKRSELTDELRLLESARNSLKEWERELEGLRMQGSIGAYFEKELCTDKASTVENSSVLKAKDKRNTNKDVSKVNTDVKLKEKDGQSDFGNEFSGFLSIIDLPKYQDFPGL